MKLELISFKICPFVQRSVITLRYKQQPFDITFIELDDPPPWFLEISPFGRVPALRVDDDTVLFESAIINEFVDDVTPGSLKPDDPLLLAKNRGWIQFGEQCLYDQHAIATAQTEEDFDEAHDKALRNLGKLESILGSGPCFNGIEFSLVDCAFAPLWMRYDLLNARHPLYQPEDFPKITAWSLQLGRMDAVRDSVVSDFDALFLDYVRKHGDYAAKCFS